MSLARSASSLSLILLICSVLGSSPTDWNLIHLRVISVERISANLRYSGRCACSARIVYPGNASPSANML